MATNLSQKPPCEPVPGIIERIRTHSRTTPLAPTVEAIDDFYNGPDRSFRGVNIWTKGSKCRCITGRQEERGHVWYWTIRGEGSSNGSREYAIRADKIVRAEGWEIV